MTTPPVRFALVGCGRIAKNHVGPLLTTPGARLVAVCDLVQERAEPYGAKAGVPVYTNYHKMLREEAVDVVSILTPSGMHPDHAVDVMTHYRKHVVVEKPVALALDDLARLEHTATECGVKIFPIFQNRYNKAVRRVRADLLSGALGTPVLGTVRLRWCRPQRYYDRDPWRGTWALDGGALTNQGVHDLDLLLYMMGDVESVSTRIATRLVNVEVEDIAVATVRFASGALGVIEVTTAARPDDIEASISVLAEGGTAVLSGIACNQFAVYTPDPAAVVDCAEQFPDAYGFGHWPFFRDVVADLAGVAPHPIPFAEGARAVRLLNALYRSAEDGREVRVDEGAASLRLGRRDPKLFAIYETSAEEGP